MNNINKSMLQKGFSKILVIVIVLVVIGAGVLIWRYLPEPAEEQPIVKEEDSLKNSIAIAMMTSIRIEAVSFYTNNNTYDGFNCNNINVSPLCNEIEEYMGKMPVIKTSSQDYCVYVQLLNGTYFYIDSRGTAEEVNDSPENNAFCKNFSKEVFIPTEKDEPPKQDSPRDVPNEWKKWKQWSSYEGNKFNFEYPSYFWDKFDLIGAGFEDYFKLNLDPKEIETLGFRERDHIVISINLTTHDRLSAKPFYNPINLSVDGKVEVEKENIDGKVFYKAEDWFGDDDSNLSVTYIVENKDSSKIAKITIWFWYFVNEKEIIQRMDFIERLLTSFEFSEE